MQNKLMAVKIFEQMKKSGDTTNLLKKLREVSLQIEINTSIYTAIGEAKVMYYAYM